MNNNNLNEGPNIEYVNTSLLNQIRSLSYNIAEREALIEEMGRNNHELQEEMQGLKDELKRRDDSVKDE